MLQEENQAKDKKIFDYEKLIRNLMLKYNLN